MAYRIEIYEYALQNYHATKHRYFHIEKACTKKCGQVLSHSRDVKEPVIDTVSLHRSSCDLLHSSSASLMDPDIGSPNQWLYTHAPTKIRSAELGSLLLQDSETRRALGYSIDNVVNMVQTACQTIDIMTNKASLTYRNKYLKTIDTFLQKDIYPTLKTLQESYVLHIRTDNHIVVMGDLHGSYHTFWRNILRLHASGIIVDDSRFTIKPGYTLVFTGDLVDRGSYALDIILIILKMITSNPPGTVIYARGNHEDASMNISFNQVGFYEELKHKFPHKLKRDEKEFLRTLGDYSNVDLETCTAPTYAHVLFQIQKLWISCPCAVVVEHAYTGERIWFSHGGIPTKRTNILPSDKLLDFSVAIPLNKEETEACLWYDYFSKAPKNTPGIQMRVKLTPDIVQGFMTSNNVSFIIRGHQDSFSNTYLLTSDTSHEKDRNAHGTTFDKLGGYRCDENLITVKIGSRIQGPIATIDMSPKWTQTPEGIIWHPPHGHAVHAWPVLTVSTCTDLGRDIVKDGMLYIYHTTSSPPLAYGIHCAETAAISQEVDDGTVLSHV